MSRKDKLLARLQSKPKDFTWDEACTLMSQCNFTCNNKGGSSRMFVHSITKIKVRLHEPHPQKILLPYMLDQMLEGLRNAGEVTE